MEDDPLLSYKPRVIPMGGVHHHMKVYVLAPWVESKHMWQVRDFLPFLHNDVPQRNDKCVVGQKRKRISWKHKGESGFVNKHEPKLQEHLKYIYPDVYDDNRDSS